MGLRPYQQECLNRIREAAHGTERHLLVVLPTGAGKTVVFSHLPEVLDMKPGEKMLVLVHRDELCWQSADKLRKYNPTLHVGVEKAEFRASDDADIVVASVATIGRNKEREDGTWEWCDRLARFNPDQFTRVVIDEAHHAIASSYAGIMRWAKVYKPDPKYNDPRKLLLLVTATPERGDNIGLETIADKIAYSRELREMVEEKWLADIKAYRVNTDVDISNVKVVKGDFSKHELEKTVNTPARNKVIVDKYIELGENQRFLGFTVDIQHSVDLAKAFNDRGIRVFALHSGNKDHPKVDDNTRRKVLQLFREGYYRGVLSAGVLIEGFDDPGAMVGLMAAPTKSGLRYRQSVGRVLRPFPAPEEIAALKAIGKEPSWVKPYAIVLDFCDLSGRHRLNCVPTLFGLKADFDLKGKPAVKALGEMEAKIVSKKLTISAADVSSVEELNSIAERIDLFAKPTIPEEARKHSSLAWVSSGSSSFNLCLPEFTLLKISVNTLGQWEVYRSVKGVRSLLSSHATQAEAFRAADAQVPMEARGALVADAMWRNSGVTEKQALLLYKIRKDMSRGMTTEQFRKMIESRYTRGEVSQLISQSLNTKDTYRFTARR